jgi:DNA-binding transcriptional ArsR family regulator
VAGSYFVTATVKDINPVRDRDLPATAKQSNKEAVGRWQAEGSQRLSVSNGDRSFGATVSKKCERLATAIYLVTNFLSDTEPMKPRLRALSLELVRDASFVKNGSQTVEANVLEALRANILETLSLFELAFIAGLVSEMNFTILKREYASLNGTIEVKKASRESRTDSILGNNFFAPPESASHPQVRAFMSPSPRPDLYVSAPTTRTSSKGHSIGQTAITMSDRKESSRADLKNPSPRSALGGSFSTPRAITDVAKESRRARILKLVKDNREVTIKDIATHFTDLSEKTIQRELVSLVESGVLKKFGERRWSRYALA